MRSLTIILDSDGVLVNPISKLLKLYNEEYGESLTIEDIKDWDLTKFQRKGTDILKYFKQPGFFRDLKLIEGADYYIKKLIDDGHNIIIATSSSKEGIIDKIDNIIENLPFIEEDRIIPISRKFLLAGDVMLDDAFHNLINTRCKYPVIFNWQWNETIPDEYSELKDRASRVNNWEEFYNLICEIANREC